MRTPSGSWWSPQFISPMRDLPLACYPPWRGTVCLPDASSTPSSPPPAIAVRKHTTIRFQKNQSATKKKNNDKVKRSLELGKLEDQTKVTVYRIQPKVDTEVPDDAI